MSNRRGRPSKFGQPARTIVLTLPESVIAQLRAVHHDLAWAVVSLVTPAQTRKPDPEPAPTAQLVEVDGRRSLIVVDPKLLRRVPGVSVIPLADGHGLISLETGKDAADLELAVLDRLDQTKSHSREHRELVRLRHRLRRWRAEIGLRFRMRSIIVVEHAQTAADPERVTEPATGQRRGPGDLVRLADPVARVRKAARS